MTRWRESIQGTPLADIPGALLEITLVIRFSQDGMPIIFTSESRSALAYSVALRAACLPISQLETLSQPLASD